MGSLTTKPRPVQYVSIPERASVAAVTTPPDPASTPDISGDVAKAAATVRKRSLPETILTSFRGVLGQGDWVPQRKSLLGE